MYPYGQFAIETKKINFMNNANGSSNNYHHAKFESDLLLIL